MGKTESGHGGRLEGSYTDPCLPCEDWKKWDFQFNHLKSCEMMANLFSSFFRKRFPQNSRCCTAIVRPPDPSSFVIYLELIGFIHFFSRWHIFLHAPWEYGECHNFSKSPGVSYGPYARGLRCLGWCQLCFGMTKDLPLSAANKLDFCWSILANCPRSYAFEVLFRAHIAVAMRSTCGCVHLSSIGPEMVVAHKNDFLFSCCRFQSYPCIRHMHIHM